MPFICWGMCGGKAVFKCGCDGCVAPPAAAEAAAAAAAIAAVNADLLLLFCMGGEGLGGLALLSSMPGGLA